MTVRVIASLLLVGGGGYWFLSLLGLGFGGASSDQINSTAAQLAGVILIGGGLGLFAIRRFHPAVAVTAGAIVVLLGAAVLSG